MHALNICCLDSHVYDCACYRLVLFDPDWNPATDSQVGPSWDSFLNDQICPFLQYGFCAHHQVLCRMILAFQSTKSSKMQ